MLKTNSSSGGTISPPPRLLPLLALALGLAAAGSAQSSLAPVTTDALRYSMTRAELTIYEPGTRYEDLDEMHKTDGYHGPAQTTTYLALLGDGGETAVTLTYPTDEEDVPQTQMRRPGRTVMTTAGIRAYDQTGAHFYEIPVTGADSAYLYGYDYTLPRLAALVAEAAALGGTWGAPPPRASDEPEAPGASEEPVTTYDFDAEHLIATETTTLAGEVLRVSTTVYQRVAEPDGELAFPLFTSIAVPFDERGVRGTHLRTLNFSSPEWGKALRETLEREQGRGANVRLLVAPNPVAAYLRIVQGVDLTNPDVRVDIEVYGIDGRLHLRNVAVDPSAPVDLSALPAGPYVVRVDDGKHSLSTTITKQ